VRQLLAARRGIRLALPRLTFNSASARFFSCFPAWSYRFSGLVLLKPWIRTAAHFCCLHQWKCCRHRRRDNIQCRPGDNPACCGGIGHHARGTLTVQRHACNGPGRPAEWRPDAQCCPPDGPAFAKNAETNTPVRDFRAVKARPASQRARMAMRVQAPVVVVALKRNRDRLCQSG